MLNDTLTKEILELHSKLRAQGRILSQVQLDKYYQAFRERFSPKVLQALDGEALLEFMHAHGNQDSLVYWLEFKNDEQFPSIRFGSIAGGSALKFGIYKRKKTGAWMTGHPIKQKEISIPEAVEIARKHRDMFIKGADLLKSLPENATEADYAKLQKQMDAEISDVSSLAWGHKYFSLLFPDKLDDYHRPNYQRFHLVKMLQTPPSGPGRYDVAHHYVAIAEQLGITTHELTTTLNARHGGHPHKYWRIGTMEEKPRDRWSLMRDGNCVAIGWPDLGDLSWAKNDKTSRDQVIELLGKHYPGKKPVLGKKGREIFKFVAKIMPGDMVLAMQGQTVLGVGKATSDEYWYESGSDFPHRRSVKWLSLDEWKLPRKEGLRTTVYRIHNNPLVGGYENSIAIESNVMGVGELPDPGDPPVFGLIPERIKAILERKAQVILYGPPGTGKTYWAKIAARELAARSWFSKSFGGLADLEKGQITGDAENALSAVRMCCFHPSYGYEDFMEGYRPQIVNDQMVFGLQDGIFKKLCKDANLNPEKNFYLIVDEINRGDIPRIFGELITTLEKDKRGEPIWLPLSGLLRVPHNVFIIGTMNTADRSIALLDTALRRRFGFIELMPDAEFLASAKVEEFSLGAFLEELNKKVREHIGRDARNLQIGHAYFMESGQPVTSTRAFSRIFREDIIPLLQEYCYEDFTTLAKILGKAIIDEESQSIRDDIFGTDNSVGLIQALAANFPDLQTSLKQAAIEESNEDESDESENDNDEDDSEEAN